MARLALSVIAFWLFICVHAAPGVVDKYEIKGSYPNQPNFKNYDTTVSEIQPVDYNAIIYPIDYINGDYEQEHFDNNNEDNVQDDKSSARDDKISKSDDKSKVEVTSKRSNVNNRGGKVEEGWHQVLSVQTTDQIVIESSKPCDKNMYHGKVTPDHVYTRNNGTIPNIKSGQTNPKKDNENSKSHHSHDHADETPDNNDDMKRKYENTDDSIWDQNNRSLLVKAADTKDHNDKKDNNEKSNIGGTKNNNIFPYITYIRTTIPTTVLDNTYQNNNNQGYTNVNGENDGTHYKTLDKEKASHPNNEVNNKSLKSSNVKKGGSILPVLPSVYDSTDREDYADGKDDQSNNESNENYGHDEISYEQDYKSSDNKNKSSSLEDKGTEQKSKGSGFNYNLIPYWKINSDENKSDKDKNDSDKQNKVTVKLLPYWVVVGKQDSSTDHGAITEPTGYSRSCNSSNCFRNQDNGRSYFQTDTKKYHHKEDSSYHGRHYHHSDKRKGSNNKQKSDKYNNDYEKSNDLITKTKKVFKNGLEKLKNLLSTSNGKNDKKSNANKYDGSDRESKQNSRYGKDDRRRSYNDKCSYRRRKGDHYYKYKNNAGRSKYLRYNKCHTYDNSNKNHKVDDRNKGNNKYNGNRNKHHNKYKKGDTRDDNQYKDNNYGGNKQNWKHKGYHKDNKNDRWNNKKDNGNSQYNKRDGNNYDGKHGDYHTNDKSDTSRDHKRQNNDGGRRDWNHRNAKIDGSDGRNRNWEHEDYHGNDKRQYNYGNHHNWSNNDDRRNHYNNDDKDDGRDYRNNDYDGRGRPKY